MAETEEITLSSLFSAAQNICIYIYILYIYIYIDR